LGTWGTRSIGRNMQRTVCDGFEPLLSHIHLAGHEEAEKAGKKRASPKAAVKSEANMMRAPSSTVHPAPRQSPN